MARRAGRLARRVGRAWRLLPILMLAAGGCTPAVPDCDSPEARQTMADLFRKQLKLTPYVRFIDMERVALTVNAIFPVNAGQAPGRAGQDKSGQDKSDQDKSDQDKASQTSVSCVAFVRYDAPLNEAGRAVEVENRLMFNLIYELANEKQIYYRVEIEKDGRPRVHVDRVGG